MGVPELPPRRLVFQRPQISRPFLGGSRRAECVRRNSGAALGLDAEEKYLEDPAWGLHITYHPCFPSPSGAGSV